MKTDQFTKIEEEAVLCIGKSESIKELQDLKVHYLGKKGILTSLLHEIKDLPQEEKKRVGAKLNDFKSKIESLLEIQHKKVASFEFENEVKQSETYDISLEGTRYHGRGSFHPITLISKQLIRLLENVGFEILDGPEVELEFYNFEALNIPKDHPAKDMQSTFYIESPILLRTHTSTVEVRAMLEKKPPFQIASLGKVYRQDLDATHTPMFHQLEGLIVDEKLSLAHLKGILIYICRGIFGKSIRTRFRPSYFPFTEPSAEIDIECLHCQGKKDCRVCQSTGWLEILGAGMTHPNVLKSAHLNPDIVSGLAFGVGIERIAMLKYGISDARLFYTNDHRLLETFWGVE